MLVAYHGVGPLPGGALGIAYPHPIRIGTDLLVDVRMPLFAFIAGWVYALRPLQRPDLGRYIGGKVRRLIIPGIAAALVYWLLGMFVMPSSAASNANIWNVITLSYIHFWFLQSIFILLVAIGLVEGLSRRSLGPWILLGLAVAILLSPHFTFGLLRIGGAQYLAPFFLFGIFVIRHGDWVRQVRIPMLATGLAALGIGFVINLMEYQQTGIFSLQRRDLQSAFTAFGVLTVLYLLLPPIRILDAFGAASFTIYLYHVLGTSAARRGADLAGIENIWLTFFLVVAAGIFLPVVLHTVFFRLSSTRMLFLGLTSPTAKRVSG
jgi:hypothetical protein